MSHLTKIEGGPGWINSDRYTIEAKSEGVQTVMMKAGPMMAKQGPCLASDFAGVPLPPGLPLQLPGDESQCSLTFNGRKGPNAIAIARSSTMENFASLLTAITGQLVVDKTGINELFDYRLVYFPEGAAADAPDAPIPDDPPAASIFTVLQQERGLKLERARGPREYLVIDHIERPSEN